MIDRLTRWSTRRIALGMLGGLGLITLATSASCAADGELVTQRFLQDAERRRARAAAPAPTFTVTAVVASATATPTRTPRPGRTLAVVRRVWDGETILIDGGYSVRYIGVDAPGAGMFGRPVEPFGREAAARNVELVEGREVELEEDSGDVNAAGLLLRYVYVGDEMVGEVLLQEGLARLALTDRSRRHADLLRAAEARARAIPLNIWTLVTPTPTITPTPSDTPTPTLRPTPMAAVPVVVSPRVLLPFGVTRTPAPRTVTPGLRTTPPPR